MSVPAWVPSEVVLDAAGGQVLPRQDDGSAYPHYPLCVRACGYRLGTETIVAAPQHASCARRLALKQNVGTYPPPPPTTDGELIVYPEESL